MRQLNVLRRLGFNFVTLDELLCYVRGDGGLPRRPLLLTFDDGYAHLSDTVLPVLTARRIPAVVFAVSGHLGGTNVWDEAIGAPRLRLLDAEGLRRLAAASIEIGAHSRTHRPLTRVPDALLASEIAGSVNDLEAAGCDGRGRSHIRRATMTGESWPRPAIPGWTRRSPLCRADWTAVTIRSRFRAWRFCGRRDPQVPGESAQRATGWRGRARATAGTRCCVDSIRPADRQERPVWLTVTRSLTMRPLSAANARTGGENAVCSQGPDIWCCGRSTSMVHA